MCGMTTIVVTTMGAVLSPPYEADSSRTQAVDAGTFEIFPIVSYDTDVGLGLGMKLFALRPLRGDESFDLVLFNSTKGERWYRLVFAIPDFELRQSTEYPIAVDVIIDYDKWISSSFFGGGAESSFDDREFYTKEPLEIGVTLSRGFTPSIVGQVGVKVKTVRNFDFSEGSRLVNLMPGLNAGTATYASVDAAVRYDTRNSFINPDDGLVLVAEAEHAPPVWPSNVSFTRLAGSAQGYKKILGVVFAARGGIQSVIGNDLPIQVLIPVGGNSTLRGSPQDRYFGTVAAVGNAEIRFPIYWRFGGVAGFDMGRVWDKLSELGFARWATNPVVGLRFYMDTFVVRADVGFGKETTGFYLNFGHMF